MSRDRFSRSVARAAASGGGAAYRSRRPLGFYAAIGLIVVLGVGLIVYSRHERMHATKAAEGPSATDAWQSAIGFDICGTVQPALAASTNLTTVGIRTFGNDIINTEPSAAKTPADFEGAKATLGLFVKDYSGLTLTSSSLQLPGKTEHLWRNGDKCGTTAGKVQTKVWSSTSAKGTAYAGDPTKLHLTNGQMIMVAFVPNGASIPVPPSKEALLVALGKPVPTSTTTPAALPSPTASSNGMPTVSPMRGSCTGSSASRTCSTTISRTCSTPMARCPSRSTD